MPYVPNTDDDRRKMLDRIGVDKFEDLLVGIPEKLRLGRELDIPQLSEMELLREIKNLSRESRDGLVGFAGGGVYDHFIPSAVGTIVSRPEFMTAYTPYQAEVAQGTLQVIYEFQTHICRLTGMDIANASMYDGASAAAEAVALAAKVTNRNKVVIAETVSPAYRDVTRTYLSGLGIEQVPAPLKDGVTDLSRLEDLIDENTAAVSDRTAELFRIARRDRAGRDDDSQGRRQADYGGRSDRAGDSQDARRVRRRYRDR